MTRLPFPSADIDTYTHTLSPLPLPCQGTLDGIIDTVSAKHDVSALMELLAPRGKLIIVGLPPEKPTINHFGMVMR